MVTLQERLRAFVNNRWLVFVASMWIQCCGGVGYLFGSISPLIKSCMGYNQRQVASLAVAKNLGDAFGLISGALCEFLPFWGILTIGVFQNFLGYASIWFIVTNELSCLPLWMLCICIFIGTNGETYFNTACLVSCVQNFPKSRGPIVGILKGFSGLSGAILTQMYHMFSSSNQDSLILMIALGPSIVILSLMFIIRSVDGQQQIRPSDGLSFTFVYGVCLLLAVYLMGFSLLEDLTKLSQTLIILSSLILFIFLLLPLLVPVILAFFSEETPAIEEKLLPKTLAPESSKSENEVESEDEISRGENFTLQQALVKTDFWLMFVSTVLGAGAGITIIDNMGQICESLGYSDVRIFVSIISICNFLGRVGGGYFSELLVRNYTYPRPVAMAIVQLIMASGLLYYSLGWPSAIYTVTVLTGLGYGAHWAIVPASVSEMFGLKSFGALYNFFILAMPLGSFIFSGILASNIYDYYAEKQADYRPIRDDNPLTCIGTVCYSITCAILSGFLIIAVVLSMVVVHRTKTVYAHLYAISRS